MFRHRCERASASERAASNGLRGRGTQCNIVFVAPYAMAATVRFVRAVAAVPGARVVVISSDPAERFGDAPIAGHWHLADCLDVDALDRRRRRGRRPRRWRRPPARHPREPPGAARRGAPASRHPRHRPGRRRQLPRQGADEGGVRRRRRAVCPQPAGRLRPGGDRLRLRGRLPVRRQAARRRRRPQHVPRRRRCPPRRVAGDVAADRRPADAPRGVHDRPGTLLRQRRDRRRDGVALDQPLPAEPARRARASLDPVVRAAAAADRRSGRHRRHRRPGAAGARPARRAVAHGVVPAAGRQRRHLRGRGPAAGLAVHDADVVRPRHRPLRRLGQARRRRRRSTRRNAPTPAVARTCGRRAPAARSSPSRGSTGSARRPGRESSRSASRWRGRRPRARTTATATSWSATRTPEAVEAALDRDHLHRSSGGRDERRGVPRAVVPERHAAVHPRAGERRGAGDRRRRPARRRPAPPGPRGAHRLRQDRQLVRRGGDGGDGAALAEGAQRRPRRDAVGAARRHRRPAARGDRRARARRAARR